MKTVWVNRFNADGTVKPMSEWQQRAVHDTTTHIMLEGERIFQGTHDNTLTSNGRSGIHEYIGNQRGDGWLYVADDEMPMCYVEVWTSDGCDYDKDHVDIDSNTGAEYFVNSGDGVICWQPIQRPQAACKEPT